MITCFVVGLVLCHNAFSLIPNEGPILREHRIYFEHGKAAHNHAALGM